MRSATANVMLVTAGLAVGFFLGLVARSQPNDSATPRAARPVQQQQQQQQQQQPGREASLPVPERHAYPATALRGEEPLDTVVMQQAGGMVTSCLTHATDPTVAASAAPAQIHPCRTGDLAQMWVWESRSAQGAGVLRGSGGCLGLPTSSPVPVMLPCTASESTWLYTAARTLKHQASGKCLASRADGSLVGADCTQGINQIFVLLDTQFLLTGADSARGSSGAVAPPQAAANGATNGGGSEVAIVQKQPAPGSLADDLSAQAPVEASITVVLWHRGWCLDRFSADSIVAYSCQIGSRNQMWTMTPRGQVQGANACLVVKGRGVALQACSESLDQQWEFTNDGHWRHKQSKLCLQVSEQEMQKVFAAECRKEQRQIFDLMDSSVLAKDSPADLKPPKDARKVTLWHQGWCLDRFSPHRIVSYGCQKGSENQLFYWADDGHIRVSARKCMLPTRTGGLIVARCPPEKAWKYTENYQLIHLDTRLCLQTHASQMEPASMHDCDPSEVRQRWLLNSPEKVPFKPDFDKDPDAKVGHSIWAATSVPEQLNIALKRLQQVAKAVDDEPVAPVGHRRAAVLFQHSGTTDQLRWWIKAWHAVGLDTADAAFDVFVAVEHNIIPFLPAECKRAPATPAELPMSGTIPGRCIFVEMVPISLRDPVYGKYGYMNSLECMYNAATVPFLSRYKLLMRTDLDTFPTPRLVGWWPEETIMADGHSYSYGTVGKSLAKAATEAGLRHYGKTGLASTWYGPSQELIKISRVTVAAGRYILYKLFGHSPCRQPEERRPKGKCDSKENQGEWSKTLYEGVALLYAQELGANHVWGAHGKTVRYGVLDHGTESSASLCVPYHLHVHHNADVFSKMAYVVNKYDKLNLDELDLSTIRGFSAYMACSANDKGIGGDKALAKVGGSFLYEDLCKNKGKR